MPSQNQSLKILFATTVPSTLGFTVPVTQKLREDGHLVAHVADLSAGDVVPDHVEPIRSIPMSRAITPLKDLVALGRWIRFLRKTKPDVIVSGSPKASLLSLIAGKVVGIPRRIYVLHGAVWDGKEGRKSEILKMAERLSFRSATTVLAVSDSLAQALVDNRITDQKPFVLGRGSVAGVDLDKFQYKEKASASAMRRVAFVGRLSRDKNIGSLLEVFDSVSGQVETDLELHIYGDIDLTAPIPPEVDRRLKSDPSIICHGFSSDIATALGTADVLVFPSSREGLPQVVLEAQACGVPVVAWSCTGVVDAVSAKNRELLTQIGDTGGMAEQVTKVLVDHSFARELALDGRGWVEAHFDCLVVAHRTSSFIVGSALA